MKVNHKSRNKEGKKQEEEEEEGAEKKDENYTDPGYESWEWKGFLLLKKTLLINMQL